MRKIHKSANLNRVCYDIRGIVLEEAKRMEAEGSIILKLNIGNPALFDLFVPDEIVHDMIINLHNADGYSDSKGLFAARKAVMQYYQQKGIYDGCEHTSVASLADDILFITFNGLSKSYRSAGFRSGWMVLTGALSTATDYLQGLNILASMRLCSNVPGQFAIQTALGGYQSIDDLVAPGGRLREQRDACFQISSDKRMVLDFLQEKKVLLVQGTGFNWPDPDHFRVVFLPPVDILTEALHALRDFLSTYKQDAGLPDWTKTDGKLLSEVDP